MKPINSRQVVGSTMGGHSTDIRFMPLSSREILNRNEVDGE